jgi:hypothetical protein
MWFIRLSRLTTPDDICFGGEQIGIGPVNLERARAVAACVVTVERDPAIGFDMNISAGIDDSCCRIDVDEGITVNVGGRAPVRIEGDE